MSGFKVLSPGILSLIQDKGRFGFHDIGITSGGPFDSHAFNWANRLFDNKESAACLEILVGGLLLKSQTTTQLAVTGADVPIKINDQKAVTWQTHSVKPGDKIAIGYATAGCRAYLSVAGGIQAPLIFGSASTVIREQLGGLYKNGQPLQTGDILPCMPGKKTTLRSVPEQFRTQFDTDVTEVRLVPGYQYDQFSQAQLDQFFNSEYKIANNSDRMGYRLEGPAIKPPSRAMLSEGICLGAVQLPADGQPIILLCDRQTIGGYPKIGSVLSLDIAKLAQLMPGKRLQFTLIAIDQAQNLLRHCKQ